MSRITPVPLQRGQVMWRPLVERRAQPLARQFHQPEARDLAHLHARAVELQRVLEPLSTSRWLRALLHVDEVDHDQAAEVAQAQLARHLLGGFEVGAGRGFLDVRALAWHGPS